LQAGGALLAAEFCRDLGFLDVILEGDSLSVIQAIRNPNMSWTAYGQIIGDAKMVLSTRRSWMVNHVRRTANFAANTLAKAALRFSSEAIWLEEIPPCIAEIVSLEQSAL
jgi:ribonuclease HI